MTVITQVDGLRPKERIEVSGVTYRLRKDATDPTASFNHQRVIWLNTGCEMINQSPSIHFCWIMGVVPPQPNTLEVPTSVLYCGFHKNKITMNPQSLTERDLECMHIYTCDARSFAFEFSQQFLSQGAVTPPQRESITPYPVENTMPEMITMPDEVKTDA